MNKLLGNFFSSPRTTLAGLGSVVLGALLSQALPQIVAALGSNPSPGWQLLGLILGAAAGGLMADAKKKLDSAAAPAAPSAPPTP